MRLHKFSKGFTLIEVMMASFIGLICLTGVGMTLTESGSFMSRDNRFNIYSLNAIRDQMDTLRNTHFDSIAVASDQAFSNAQLLKIPAATGRFTVTSGSTFSMGADIKKVTVTVSWTGARGQAMSNTITTLMTRTGINGA